MPITTDDVLDLIDAAIPSAAIGAALELGLFWRLDAAPMHAEQVAEATGISPRRSAYWLQLLCRAGLLVESPRGYAPSSAARSAILEAYEQETWALLAEEARERLPALCELPVALGRTGSIWKALGRTPPRYVEQMTEDPHRACRFTRMLYELHAPLAEALAKELELGAARRLMDLGGGSGVVSLALVRRYPALIATVVDIANVCAAGHEIAVENALQDRVLFHAADFHHDRLPSGFDVVLECDVNLYSEELFHKVRDALRPGGRFVIVDQFAPAPGIAPSSRLHWAFAGSLESPEFAFPTAGHIRDLLTSTGFQCLSEKPLITPTGAGRRFSDEMVKIEARSPDGGSIQ